jgi:steroid 5-alpha reductase family enzyme
MQPGLLLIVAISLSAIMALAWALERKSGKSGWIDAIWSFSVGLGSVIAVMFADATWQRRSAILILILAWSLRLGLHIAQRSMGHGEDPRYAKLIKEWGEKASSRLFWFLQIQALAAFMLVLAVYLAAVSRPAFPSFWDLTRSSRSFAERQKPRPKFAKPAFGPIPDIQTISLNGCSGVRGR